MVAAGGGTASLARAGGRLDVVGFSKAVGGAGPVSRRWRGLLAEVVDGAPKRRDGGVKGRKRSEGDPDFSSGARRVAVATSPYYRAPRTPPGLQVATGTQKSAEVPWRPSTVLIYG